jgi:hypothetical protein
MSVIVMHKLCLQYSGTVTRWVLPMIAEHCNLCTINCLYAHVQVYSSNNCFVCCRYKAMEQQRELLPVYEHKFEILDLIANNQVQLNMNTLSSSI